MKFDSESVKISISFDDLGHRIENEWRKVETYFIVKVSKFSETNVRVSHDSLLRHLSGCSVVDVEVESMGGLAVAVYIGGR